MSLAIVYSRANVGIDAPLVTVETHLSNGLPGFSIVGLPETAVKESKERVRSAILNANLEFPARRITVNLAPADLPKAGGRFDLAIAIGILAASGQIESGKLANLELLGELALTGEVRPVSGVLPGVIAGRKVGNTCLLPAANGPEAGLVKEADVFLVSHLLNVCAYLKGEITLARAVTGTQRNDREAPDLLEVRGQHQARRALLIAAAGGHNLLLRGPPGTGKTMLASRIVTILPPLTEEEALEVAAIRSIAGQRVDSCRWKQPPFRSPHHTSSAVALVGGGSSLNAGEISLSHCGVLFLDELPEFNSRVLNVLREPLESGVILISRASYQVSLPARFQLVAAMNPCPCGYFGDRENPCRCSGEQVRKYQQKISGPLLDRIDMHVEVCRQGDIRSGQLLGRETDQALGSQAIREQVIQSRSRQLERVGKVNAHMTSMELETCCRLDRRDETVLEEAAANLHLSQRACHRLLKIARTIADLAGETAINRQHLLEAINYRPAARRP